LSDIDKEKIIRRAEWDAKIGQQYFWAPGGGPKGIHLWLSGYCSEAEIGQDSTKAISCYEYFLMLCIQEKVIDKNKIKDIYWKCTNSGNNNRAAGALSKNFYSLGVWKDWPTFGNFRPLNYFTPKNYWRPRRGDLVFFNNKEWGGDFYHVALACGRENKATVISFGDSQTSGRSQRVPVKEVAIGFLQSQVRGVVVKFANPVWA
jgi:hypothetical protein